MAEAQHHAPPVPKEQAFLETFFQCISKFAYDKAKELTERERESIHKGVGPSSITWSALVSSLLQLAVAEKAYASLAFLGAGQNLAGKFFHLGRKDSLKNSYQSISSDLRKMEDASVKNLAAQRIHSEPESDVVRDSVQGHLCGHIAEYINARIRLMEFYEQIAAMATYRNMSWEDLRVVITDVKTAVKHFHHPTLSPISSVFTLECEILLELLESQIKLAEVNFFDSLIHLRNAKIKIASWASEAIPKEERKWLLSSSKSTPTPVVHTWLTKFHMMLMAKYSLYHYEILSKQAPPGECSKLIAKSTTLDLYGKIVQFHKKCDVSSTSLVLSCDNSEHETSINYKGPGYHHPKKVTEKRTGMDSFPIFFSYPGERPEKHMPNIVSIITEKEMELNAQEKVAYFYDQKFQSSYFLARADAQTITLVIVFDVKKPEKDHFVQNFIAEMCGYLRCTKLVSLKPGSK